MYPEQRLFTSLHITARYWPLVDGSWELLKLLQNRLTGPLKKYDARCNGKITEMFSLQHELECHMTCDMSTCHKCITVFATF